MHILNIVNRVNCYENVSVQLPDRMKDMLAKETGRDRIIRMYSTSDLGISPELMQVLRSSYTIAGLAGMFGAFKGAHKAREDFHRKNVASTFESQHLARRNLTDSMSLAALRECGRHGLKYGGFSSLYLLGTTTAANYRNKVSVWEHAACAGILGSLYRINFGIKGMLVAGCLGGCLGLIAGGLIKLSFYLTGTSVEELRYWQHHDYYARLLKKRTKPEEEKQEN